MASATLAGLAIPVLRTRLVPLFLRRARDMGVDDEAIAAVAARFDIPKDVPDDGVTIGLTAFQSFAAELASLVKDDLFGFHAALESRRGDFGALEYVMRNAPTVRDALGRLARYDHAINTQVRVEIDLSTGRVVERIPGHPECLGRHGNEFAVAHKVKVARDLLGASFAPRRIFFAHAPPVNRATMREIEDWFRGSEIVHRADANGIELTPSLLEMPIDRADPALLGILEERLGDGEKKEVGEKDDLAAIRRAIAEDVTSADLDGDAFASRLGMSRRTLHRKLHTYNLEDY